MAEESTITVTVDRTGAPRVYASPKEFHAWLGTETEKWKWLEEVRARHGSVKPMLVSQYHPLGHLLSQLSAASGEPQNYQRHAINTAIDISERVKNGKLLTSEDPAGKFVLELVEQRRPLIAAFALGHFTKTSLTPTEEIDDNFEGKFRAAAFAAGLLESATAEKAALLALSAEFRTAIEAQRAEAKTAAAQHEILRAEFALETEKAKQSHEAAEKQRGESSEKALASYEEQFGQLRDAFNVHMALKAPVEYWTDSTLRHQIAGGVFGALAILWGLIIGIGVLKYATILSEQWQAKVAPPVQGQAAQIVDPPYWEIGLLVFIVTLAIWFLRILIRLMLSNLHQAADAKSRATMTQAYLALIESGKAIADSDRILVLATIFRPMATGLIKGDEMPPSLMELLSRIVGGREK